MRNNINAGSFVEAINASNFNRFTVQADDKLLKYSLLADDENLTDIAVMRLGRLKTETTYFRTVLISVLKNKDELPIALRWAAEVKRELLDPETSDLYMIIVIPDFPNESCTRIESTEAFCRKFVLRSDESPDELISRTFIAHLSEETSTEEITDPLTEALRKTENDYSWFDTHIQKQWKECLLSGETGFDLIEKLYADTLMEDQIND